MWRATVLTLFPEMFPGPLGLSLAGDALARGVWELETRQLREHGLGRHRAVDDTPAGGGPGMVMRADVLCAAIDAAAAPDDGRPFLLMSPRGAPLSQARVREFARGPGALILCARFEGVDERVIAARGLGGGLRRRLHPLRRRNRGAGADGRLRAAFAGRDGRRGFRRRGKFRRRPAGISAIYAPARLRGTRDSACFIVGRSRQDRALAAG